MADVCGIPFLEIVVRNLIEKGARRFVLLTGYMSPYIEAHFADFDPEISIEIAREQAPLGTGGAVKAAEHFAGDPTLLVNGDTFFDVELGFFLDFFRARKPDAALSLFQVPDAGRYGMVGINEDYVITSFAEKAPAAAGTSGLINAGVTLLSRAFIHALPTGAFSMERDIFPGFVSTGRLLGFPQNRAFFDIGAPESYAAFARFYTQELLRLGRG
jgi:NDP-sugar pyrophosphorylase family protein